VSEVLVARLDELMPGEPTLVDAEGVPVVLTRVGDRVYACADRCAHRGGPLSRGRLTGTRLACPWHGWMYDVRSGECVLPGRAARVPVYPVRLDGTEVWLEMGG
jgi:nitrite reductase/ring-hydroxylating ferredoxin subunit